MIIGSNLSRSVPGENGLSHKTMTSLHGQAEIKGKSILKHIKCVYSEIFVMFNVIQCRNSGGGTVMLHSKFKNAVQLYNMDVLSYSRGSARLGQSAMALMAVLTLN